MDAGRVSDFSIERILSPQLGPRPPAAAAAGSFTPPAPVPVPVPVPVLGCLQYRGMNYGDACYPFGSGFHHTDFHPTPAVFPRLSPDAAEARTLGGYHGYHPATDAPAQPQAQPRQKARMRTVFTDAQSRQLEALFARTDYPPAEARAELARSAGLSEETVRVWFKNRRARRKRQCSGSKVKAPPSPAAADRKLFTSFL